jgi:hypothetical protein
VSNPPTMAGTWGMRLFSMKTCSYCDKQYPD